MIPAKVFCLKVDYAEATGTHNTQTANFVETLYSEQFPAQKDNSKFRSTIYGFPSVIFHQQDETSTPVFYGKSNFNYDKGAENVYGFTEDYNVESWEFLNNTSDACNFIDEIPEMYSVTDPVNGITSGWINDFEARYPDECEDISNFRRIHHWVVTTNQNKATNNPLPSPIEYDGKTYTNDTAEYRLAKFKAEFTQYFNMHFSLIYYVWSFFALMVDQRAKNMFITIWNGIGYPYFYDNDTIFGIDNRGLLKFDYYHEDRDKVGGANVYNGQNSVLWVNFRQAFDSEIKQTWCDLRSSKKITYEKLVDRFITQGSDKWSESIYNEDMDFKYVSMLRSDGDASNLFQIRGDGKLHLMYFLKNRLDYCDSWADTANYIDDVISLRIYTPSVGSTMEGKNMGGGLLNMSEVEIKEKINKTLEAVPPNADISIVPYSWMYSRVAYKANSVVQKQRTENNEKVTFKAPNETFNDTETGIYGASNISSVVDLAPLYCAGVNVSKATKLVNLKVGDGNPNYFNSYLKELTLGTNRLLKTLDVRNCPRLDETLDLKGCPNIETILAEGTNITSVSLTKAGYIKTMHLPDTITNLTITNQHYLSDFQLNPVSLKTLVVEHTPAVNISEIIATSKNLERVRLVDVEWTETNNEFLKIAVDKLKVIGGRDEFGHNTEKAVLTGTVHVKDISLDLFQDIAENFPFLTVLKDNKPIYFVKYVDYDKSNLYSVIVAEGEDAINPVTEGYIETPIRENTENTRYVFKDFGNSSNITKNTTLTAVYTEIYRVQFVDYKETVYETQWVERYKSATRPTVTLPNRPTDAQYVYTFAGWNSYSYITYPRSVSAYYSTVLRKYTVYFRNSDNSLLLKLDDVPYGTTPVYTGDIPTDNNQNHAGFYGWRPTLGTISGNSTFVAVYTSVIENKEIEDSWESIVTNVNNGEYKNRYKLGNYKILDIGDKSFKMTIVAIEKDDLLDDEDKEGGKAPLTFVSEELYPTPYRFNPILNYDVYIDTWDEVEENHWVSGNRWVGNTVASCVWKINVIDSGSLKIKYKIQSEYYDKFTIQVNEDDNYLVNTCGVKDWEEKRISVLARESLVIKATYTKDSSGFAGEDRAEVIIESDGRIKMEWIPTPVTSSNPYIKKLKSGTGIIGGWEHSDLRKFIDTEITSSLPSVVRNAIKPVKKIQNAYDEQGHSLSQVTSDKLWIPSRSDILDKYSQTLGQNVRYRMKKPLGEDSFNSYHLRDAYPSRYSGNFGTKYSDLGQFTINEYMDDKGVSNRYRRVDTEGYFPICFCL